ncbi:MAG TPA: hypothetical protein VGP33_04170 [Chloroflexota bacterium]|jgi:hypothetical protein|nr:hypothetical protein [Chloroflexota bacterium]
MLPGYLSRRAILRAVTVALPLAALANPVLAGEEWCEDDPAMLLTTPHGNILLVYITQSGQGGLQHLADLELATLSYAASSSNLHDGSGGLETTFHVHVTIPSDLIDGGFATKVTVSSGPFASGAVYASMSGNSGTTFDLVFTVPLA